MGELNNVAVSCAEEACGNRYRRLV